MLEEVVIDKCSTAVEELEQEMVGEEERGSSDGIGLDNGLGLADGTIEIDEAKDARDKQAVTSVRTAAAEAMKIQGVLMSDKEEKGALGLFPKAQSILAYCRISLTWPLLGCWPCSQVT